MYQRKYLEAGDVKYFLMKLLLTIIFTVALSGVVVAWTHGGGGPPPVNPCSSNAYKLDFSNKCNSLYINTITN